MERKRTFIDGMESVSLTDGMIRMELYNVLVGKKSNSSEPNPHEICEELIMTPQCFMKVFSTMENLVHKLEEAGIITRKDVAPAPEKNQETDLSPNFQ